MSNSTRRTNILSSFGDSIRSAHPRNLIIAIVLLTALFAFEMFNFDTTRYALNSLLGNVTFVNVSWATILAIAFCAIDFAGLARLFTPEKGAEEPKEVWYLMGAWLLGATMNAMMTWWAVSLTLLNHDLGNEVLGREQLLRIVPIFVATLVWLTRILFIGSLTVAGEHLFDLHGQRNSGRTRSRSTNRKKSRGRAVPKPSRSRASAQRPASAASFSAPQREELTYVDDPDTPVTSSKPAQPRKKPTPKPVRQSNPTPARTSRIQRRPTVGGKRPGMPVGMRAKGNGGFDARKKMS